MKSVTHLQSLVPSSAPDRWFVTDGTTAIGPVNLELLARGIDAGKVQLESFVRHETWKNWRRLSDLVETEPSFDARRTFRILDAVPIHIAGTPAPPATDEEAPTTTPSRHEMASGDLFASASDLPEALLLLLAVAVQRCEAEVALIHDVRDDGAIVVCSHGARMFEVLGDRIGRLDPSFLAATSGATVMAEPTPGIAGQAIRTRLSKLGRPARAAFMVPILPRGRLLAFLEVGRTTAFRAHDVAAVETLVEALVHVVEESGWAAEWLPQAQASR